jgi:hypothetical protein
MPPYTGQGVESNDNQDETPCHEDTQQHINIPPYPSAMIPNERHHGYEDSKEDEASKEQWKQLHEGNNSRGTVCNNSLLLREFLFDGIHSQKHLLFCLNIWFSRLVFLVFRQDYRFFRLS